MSTGLTSEQEREAQEQAAAQAAINHQKKLLADLTLKRGLLALDVEARQEQHVEYLLCKTDIFYWIENYVWIHEPRSEPQEIPFRLYDFQEEDVRWVMENIEATIDTIDKRDLLIEKSRGMGWSWLIITISTWYWLFHNKSILFGSRKLEECDKLGDMGTLLEKARFIVRRLPKWMLPAGFDVKEHLGFTLLRNPNGGAITGESSNPNFGRGDRKLFTVFDEFPAWPYDLAAATSAAGTTNCRIFIGTPKGPYNCFALMARDPKFPIKPDKRRRHWVEHPVYGAGVRTDQAGKPTSPWYRKESTRFTADGVASELDIDYIASAKGLVFGDYVPKWHRVEGGIQPDPSRPIIRVWDPGNTFAVLWLQVDKWGRVLVLDELVVETAHTRDVANAVIAISQDRFPEFEFEDFGDPHGSHRNSEAATHPTFEILREDFDIWVDDSPMSSLPSGERVKTRIQAIHNQLAKTCAELQTHGLLIDADRCPYLDRALLEGYRYKVDRLTQRVLEIVDEEHPWEDVVDCLGMGIVAKLGLAFHRAPKRTLKVAKNVINWPGRRSRYR